MNTQDIKVKWSEQKDKLKQRFTVLTDNDLLFEVGKKEEMLGRIEEKLGTSKEELRKIISSF